MAKICYTAKKFGPERLRLIELANAIILRYRAQGFTLTVRQIYYQFVSMNAIPNQPEEYNKIQSLLNDARLAGLVDWDHIVDRTRGVRSVRHYAHPRDVLAQGSQSFRFWKWEDQPNYVEVWVEKDALVDVVGSVCDPLDVPYFSCRGYTSVSEVHAAAMRFQHEIDHGKTVRVIHLGDHDPSGLDMTRDIAERLQSVFGVPAKIYRCALNKNQVDQFNLPKNPAKLTDARAMKYIEEHGSSSWELDALDVNELARIIKVNIDQWLDRERFDKVTRKEERARDVLGAIHDRWNEVYKMMQEAPRE